MGEDVGQREPTTVQAMNVETMSRTGMKIHTTAAAVQQESPLNSSLVTVAQ